MNVYIYIYIHICEGKRIKTGAGTQDKQVASQQRRCTRVKIKFLEIWMGQQETQMYVYAYKHICIYMDATPAWRSRAHYLIDSELKNDQI